MSDRKSAVLLGLAAFLVLLPGAFVELPDGKFVVGATRILAGEVPYRDFWTMYAPGSFYLVAGLFSFFGRELAVQGIAACGVWAATAAVFFLLLRDTGAGRGVALACAFVLALARWQTGVEITTYEPALLLAAIGWRALLSDRLLRSGACLGAAALFKHDVAAYAAVGAALALLLGRRNPIPLLAGSLAVVVPVAALLAFTAGADAWRDLIVFPATDFPAVRAEAYPHLLPRAAPLSAWMARPTGFAEIRAAALALARWVQCVLPELSFLGACAAALRLRGRTPRPVLLVIACLPFFWLAAHVQANTHLHTMAALSMLLFARAWHARAVPRPALAAIGAVYAIGLLCVPVIGAATALRRLSDARALDIPGTALLHAPSDEADALRPLAATVGALVPSDEPIYVGLERHDATVISKPIVYFLCSRPPAVRYHELHPGVTDREDVQQEMIGRIEASGARCIVLWRFGWSKERLDAIRDRNRAAVAGAGSTLLDRWIAERTVPIADFGEYRVFQRRR